MSPASNAAQRWALLPIDARSHLLAEPGSAPRGMLVTRCGQLVPCSVHTSADPAPGPRCPICAPEASQTGIERAVNGGESVPEPSPALLVSLALRRAHRGGVTKMGNHYFDRGFPTSAYLVEAFDALVEGGLLALADPDSHGLQRVTLTDTGQAWHAQLKLHHARPRPRGTTE